MLFRPYDPVQAATRATVDDLVCVLVDSVENSISPAPGRPHVGRLEPQLLADPLRILNQRSGDEICRGDAHRLGQAIGYRPSRWRGENQFVGFAAHDLFEFVKIVEAQDWSEPNDVESRHLDVVGVLSNDRDSKCQCGCCNP